MSVGREKSPVIFWGNTNKDKEKKQALTYGAVGSGPLVVADAGSRLGAEGAVIGALLGTSALEDLAADAPPARVAVALSVMTGSVTGARGVHAVHCGHTRTHTVSALRHNIKAAHLAAGTKWFSLLRPTAPDDGG